MKREVLLVKVILLVIGFFFVISVTPCTAEEKSYTFNASVDAPEEEITYVYAKSLADKIESLSEGRIKVKVYPNATLGGDRESIESCINGDITFVVQNTAPQVNFMPKLAIFDIPCFFDDLDSLRKAEDDPEFFAILSKIYDDAGLKAFKYTDQGFRLMTSNKKIEKIDDFKGIKIRTMENANHIAFWKALSANPTPMAFGEVYIGLQQGTIDGLENPYEGIATSKFYEQQKYLVDTNHVPHLVSLIMSKKIYDSLASSDQELIIQAAQEARDEIRKESDEIMAGRINTIKEGGVTFINLTPEDRKIIREKVKDVNEKITDEVGIDFVAALRKASQ